MHRSTFTSFLLALCALFTLVLSARLQRRTDAIDPILERLVPAVWSGEINGRVWELAGTIEEVVAELQIRHPGVDLVFDNNATTTTLVPRNKVQPALCIPVAGQSWDRCELNRVRQGVKYMSDKNTAFNIPPRKCGRVSCSYSAAIIFCNDNDYAIGPNSQYLASYASDIAEQCKVPCDPHLQCTFFTGGQMFDTDNYNIIVRYEEC